MRGDFVCISRGATAQWRLCLCPVPLYASAGQSPDSKSFLMKPAGLVSSGRDWLCGPERLLWETSCLRRHAQSRRTIRGWRTLPRRTRALIHGESPWGRRASSLLAHSPEPQPARSHKYSCSPCPALWCVGRTCPVCPGCRGGLPDLQNPCGTQRNLPKTRRNEPGASGSPR